MQPVRDLPSESTTSLWWRSLECHFRFVFLSLGRSLFNGHCFFYTGNVLTIYNLFWFQYFSYGNPEESSVGWGCLLIFFATNVGYHGVMVSAKIAPLHQTYVNTFSITNVMFLLIKILLMLWLGLALFISFLIGTFLIFWDYSYEVNSLLLY